MSPDKRNPDPQEFVRRQLARDDPDQPDPLKDQEPTDLGRKSRIKGLLAKLRVWRF